MEPVATFTRLKTSTGKTEWAVRCPPDTLPGALVTVHKTSSLRAVIVTELVEVKPDGWLIYKFTNSRR